MNRSILRALLVLAPLALLCGGCLAVGQSFNLATVVVSLLASGAGSVVVAALDKRDHVLSGARQPFFAGTFRGGFGNPFDVLVKDRQPLSNVLSEVAAAGLTAKGFKATSVTTQVGEDDAALKQKLTAQGADRQVIFGINTWHSDTMTNVAMHYNLTVEVLDGAGNLLATHSITGAEDGKDNLKGSVMNPPKYAKKAVPKAFAGHIEALLNHDEIVKALS